MKRLTALAVLIVAFAFAAYAGPYFIVEQNPLDPEAYAEIGWDFTAPFVDATNLSIAGGFYVINDNLWMYPTPWIGGFDLGFAWANGVGRDVFEMDLGMQIEVTPIPWPDYVELDNWATSLEVIGKPSSGVTIYGEIALIYKVTNPPGPTGWIGVWNFVPIIGLECRW